MMIQRLAIAACNALDKVQRDIRRPSDQRRRGLREEEKQLSEQFKVVLALLESQEMPERKRRS
jgi:hypothetical protein